MTRASLICSSRVTPGTEGILGSIFGEEERQVLIPYLSLHAISMLVVPACASTVDGKGGD